MLLLHELLSFRLCAVLLGASATSIVWSKARAGLTLEGEFCNLFGQGIALGLDHFTSGGQLGGFALDLGGNGTGQCQPRADGRIFPLAS